ncbi:carbohydrate ABC transporter permease [Actinospica sp.]|uniref:carbohydrate ABC transporter permease n=1 Tax=Actinospica sp. TaxID=1872142 RepID=UPI002CF351D0|nr:carbohydrate ABC transporter permease [Actinospica sp.]HWG25941.1 carbohydrate ABC transporter permease [Actinospica sp.]
MAAVASAAVRPRRRRVSARRRRATIGWNILGLLLSVFIAFPVYWLLLTSVEPTRFVQSATPNFLPKAFSFSSYSEVIHDPVFTQDLVNSLIITASTVLFSLLIGFFAALALARFRFRGKSLAIIIVMGVQMVPLIALLFPLNDALSKAGLGDTSLGVIIAYVSFTAPFTVWTLRTFIANVPRELDEAALVDGCTRFQTFYKVILPLTLPGLVATGVFGWIQAWNEFLMANILLTDNSKQTVQLYLVSFGNSPTHGADWGGLMAASTLVSIPVIILFLIFQRWMASGLTAGAVKG